MDRMQAQFIVKQYLSIVTSDCLPVIEKLVTIYIHLLCLKDAAHMQNFYNSGKYVLQNFTPARGNQIRFQENLHLFWHW